MSLQGYTIVSLKDCGNHGRLLMAGKMFYRLDGWENKRKTNLQEEKEDLWNSKPVTRTSVPGKIMEQMLLDSLSRVYDGLEVTGNN